MKKNGIFLCIPFIFLSLISSTSFGQRHTIHGSVADDFTKEKVAYASIAWKNAKYGTVSDSLGNFTISATGFTKDTLVITYVGLETKYLPIDTRKDTGWISVIMGTSKKHEGVVVKSKHGRGYYWWKNMVKHKPQNDPFQYNSYSYGFYNKLEIDIENIKREKFENNQLLKPFAFILNNVDSFSEKKPFLPMFFTESISNCYYSNNPNKKREEIKAVQTNGIKNETIMQYVGGINSRINAYQNYSVLFGKEFISPLSTVGDNYYDYQAADTEYIGGERYLHLFFSPRRDGENTFSGDLWIHQKNWALKKITLNSSPTANINYVNRITIIQEFAQINDSTWVFAKDKFITNISLTKKESLSFIARKTSVYSDVKIEEPSIAEALKKNTISEQVILNDSAKDVSRDSWVNLRPTPLSKNELKVFTMIDTLKSMPLVKKYVSIFSFVLGGRTGLGKYLEIGPWYRWFSGNQLEKMRMRFDLATTDSFSKQLKLHTYLAYGFGDKALKGKFDMTYKFPANTGWSMYAGYLHDLDNGRVNKRDEDNTTDNLFSQIIRRSGIKQKFLLDDEVKLWGKKEWENNFSAKLQFTRTRYETFKPLASHLELSKDGRNIINSEFTIGLRYAPGEKTIRTKRRDLKIKGSNPVFNLELSEAIPSIFGGQYRYFKTVFSVEQSLRLPRWGKINYELYGGKYFGNDVLPFMLLEVHPGNEIYYYNKNTFNLMNRFEYISDQYAGVSFEHNFDKKLLNLLPFMRKSNMRQFWNFKTVVGDLSPGNKRVNIRAFPDYVKHNMYALNKNAYTEIGTGFENIFKFLRIDAVWRFSPTQQQPANPNPNNPPNKVYHFGIFGSLHFQL